MNDSPVHPAAQAAAAAMRRTDIGGDPKQPKPRPEPPVRPRSGPSEATLRRDALEHSVAVTTAALAAGKALKGGVVELAEEYLKFLRGPDEPAA